MPETAIEWVVMLMLGVILGAFVAAYPGGEISAGWVPALWQERFGSDAIAGIVGLMAGSYVCAETSDYLGTTIQKIGNRGRIMLPDLISMRITVFLVIFVPLLVSSLFLLQRLAP